MELSSLNIKKIHIFSQTKAFLIFFQKKSFLIFPEMEPCTSQPKPKLLIAFAYFITISSGAFILPLILLSLFECIHFTNFFYHDCFLCCCTTSATDLRVFFYSQAFFTLLTLLLDIWHNLLLPRLPWGGQFSLEGCRAFH